ncbi:MAG: tRNA uridine(34) 5-carboxymethylaminomethyl modification radical SAM/GNAT enzyme Elp3 [Thermoproteota archaeon]
MSILFRVGNHNSSFKQSLHLYRNTKMRGSILRKPVRSASGVVVVATMCCGFQCPHGRCIYCPRFSGIPASYTGFEPSTMRGVQNVFDPFLQVSERLDQLANGGHSTEKVELIIQGGTFPSLDRSYQEWFVKSCLDAIHGTISADLAQCHRIAEEARRRCVGLTVETRPDYCKEVDVDFMLKLGVTKVEIGVQSPFDDILLRVRRGHDVEEVVDSFRIAKDSGLKVCAHMMPGLPGSSIDRELESFRLLLQDERFKPDMLKIYPTLVVKSTGLYDAWLRGDYVPPETDDVAKLVAQVKEMAPPWIRLMRVQRDIPSNLILAGVRKSNLRELAWDVLRREGKRCRCIRCREVGLRGDIEDQYDPKLTTTRYRASEGEEIFLSYEDKSKDCLFAYLRLRYPSPKAHRPEISTTRACIVRELRSLGTSLPLGTRDKSSWQHRGLGKMLMYEAERISEEDYDARKLIVTAAVGTRQYYRSLGFSLDGPYMSKFLGD